MKKFLLSIFCCLMAVFAVQAQETTATFTFKDLYGSSTLSSVESKTVDGITISYAKNSAQNDPAYNKDGTLRLYYASNGEGGSATFTTDGSKKITGIIITAYSESYTPTVKYRVDGGSLVTGTWSGATMTMSGIAATKTLTIQNANTSNTQLRIKSIVLTYENITGEGGDVEDPETPVDEAPAAPTLPDACNFDDAMTVEITGIAEGATAYYSLNNENNWVEGTSVEITETTTVYAKVVKDELSSTVVNAKYTKNKPVTPPAEGEVVDELTRAKTGVTGTTYTDWSGKSVTSSAVYAGQSAGDNDAIQLRSKNSNSGIVTTASGGNVKKIVVDWNNATAPERTLQVYGKNSAYSAPTELYSASTQGTLLGTIECGTSTELVIEGDYEYIGLRSKSGAMYLNSVEITWVEKPQPSGLVVALTVGEVGYATLYLGAAAQIPYGVRAYIVIDTSNGYAKMKEVTGIIPANTGVILVAEQGEYEFAFYDKGTADVTGNLLDGSLYNKDIDEEAYVLSAPDGVVGLYKAKMTDGTWLNNANKAYLPASAVPNKTAAFYGFEWEGTTGIEGVEAEVAQDGAIYDLSGRRVKAIAAPGIYIVNGKKVVVK